MDKPEFIAKYKSLGGLLAGDFYDSEEESDEALAQKIIKEEWVNAESLRRLVMDCERLLRSMEQEWQVFAAVANRHLDSAEEARAWLVSLLAIWEKELRKLDGKKPS